MLLGLYMALYVGQYCIYNVNNPNFPTLNFCSNFTSSFMKLRFVTILSTLQLSNAEISLHWKQAKFSCTHPRDHTATLKCKTSILQWTGKWLLIANTLQRCWFQRMQTRPSYSSWQLCPLTVKWLYFWVVVFKMSVNRPMEKTENPDCLHDALCWKRNAVPPQLALMSMIPEKPQAVLQAPVVMHWKVLLTGWNPLHCQQLSE